MESTQNFMAKMLSEDNKIGFISGILLGLCCTINGFMFHVGQFNLRVSDVMFFILVASLLCICSYYHYRYDHRIKTGLGLVFFIFIWLILSGVFNYTSFSAVFQEHFIKYVINKIIWIPVYAVLFMAFGGCNFLKGVLLGISFCSLINVVLIIYEFKSIQNGMLPNYDFIHSVGLYMAEKKNMVINQDMIRPTGLMLDPNYTGGYTGIGLIFFDYLYNNTKKHIYLFASLLCIIPMFILFSRTGLFSLFICFIISVFLKIIYPNRKYRILSKWSIALIIIMGFIALSYILSLDDDVYQKMLNRLLMKDSSAGVRMGYLEYYFNRVSILQFLFGVGNAGNFLSGFWGSSGVWAPESSVLSMFIEQGILFMIIYIIIVVRIFIRLLRRNYYYALILAYINLIGLSYNFLGDRVYYFLTCCFILYAYTPIAIKPSSSYKLRLV